ncbi:MAG: hypothetical protein AVDCRST_MAG66-3273, partial [uncultured Pseudonocardia sp.]
CTEEGRTGPAGRPAAPAPSALTGSRSDRRVGVTCGELRARRRWSGPPSARGMCAPRRLGVAAAPGRRVPAGPGAGSPPGLLRGSSAAPPSSPPACAARPYPGSCG